MNDGLFFMIMQLSKEEKLNIIHAIEEDLSRDEEGASFLQIAISNMDTANIMKRHQELSDGAMCLIEFDDHVIHLQNTTNEQ